MGARQIPAEDYRRSPRQPSRAPALLPAVLPVSSGRRRRYRPRFFLALTLVLGVVALYGCGTVVDREKLQDTIQVSLERSIHEKIKAVEGCGIRVAKSPAAIGETLAAAIGVSV